MVLKMARATSDWVPLTSSARVLRAPLIKSEPGKDLQSYHIVSIKDFPPAGYLPEPERVVHVAAKAQVARKFSVRPYDVLITIAGTIGRVSIAPPRCPNNWVPATNMFLVRLMDDPDGKKSRTFYGLMKSSLGQDLLDNLAHGSGIQIISKKAFSATLFPPFTADTLEAFEELWREETELYQRSRHLLAQADQVYSELEIRSIVA